MISHSVGELLVIVRCDMHISHGLRNTVTFTIFITKQNLHSLDWTVYFCLFVCKVCTFIKMVSSQCTGQPWLPQHLNLLLEKPKPLYIKLGDKKGGPWWLTIQKLKTKMRKYYCGRFKKTFAVHNLHRSNAVASLARTRGVDSAILPLRSGGGS